MIAFSSMRTYCHKKGLNQIANMVELYSIHGFTSHPADYCRNHPCLDVMPPALRFGLFDRIDGAVAGPTDRFVVAPKRPMNSQIRRRNAKTPELLAACIQMLFI